ncbi:methylenetetrahydrofolate reductase C-terminal domain-containing protein [Thermodesulfobacteriota bacterium B35]
MSPTERFHNSLLDRSEFTITYELVPGQGSGGKQIDRLLDFAARAKDDGRIRALSITDNAGGHPALAPVAIGSEVQRIGIEPLIHFSLKDKNRNQVKSHLFLYQRQGFHSLLVLGGDFPRSGYYGQARPVFDLDSIQTLRMMRAMEEGRDLSPAHERPAEYPSYRFLRGCVVSPFKTTEAEQVWQYARLLRKIRAGADFVVTQLGYDICKFEELLLFLRQEQVDIPVLANVFIPSPGLARLMARGVVPGVVFPDALVRTMEEEKNDPGARLVRAARMIGVLRGLGYDGVHIGGNCLDFDDIRRVMDLAEEIGDDWRRHRDTVHFPVPGSWYLYGDPRGTACATTPVPLAAGRHRGALVLHRSVHYLLFSRATPTGRLFGRLCLWLARGKGAFLLRIMERIIKEILFACRMCGDCTLAESTYLCPQSGCPKRLTNGPCGGSRNMACEVYPERRCFWVRVYDRLDPATTIHDLGHGPVLPPKDWSLDQTSSWSNYFAGRDHTTRTKDFLD